MQDFPFYIAGQAQFSDDFYLVKDLYSREDFARCAKASAIHIEQALCSAQAAKAAMAKLKAFEKRQILNECKELFLQHHEDLAQTICLEMGKTIREARIEMDRVVSTFDYASIEVMNMNGERLAMDTDPSSSDFECLIKRIPKGVCTLITPFNFPMNLIAHKVAPAIAAGCPFIIKPSDKTPLSAIKFAEILTQTSLNPEAFSVLPCDNDTSLPLITDPRSSFLSFTGSDTVGWKLKSMSDKKASCLELGGIAGLIVMPDTKLEEAASKITAAAFGQAGQSCISLQKVFIHDSIYSELKNILIRHAQALRLGNPHDEDTQLGPMISQASIQNTLTKIDEACAQGAATLCGGGSDEKFLEPTILENVPSNSALSQQEAFAPLYLIQKFNDMDKVFAEINASDYGIHMGILSQDIKLAMKAWDNLECTGLIFGHVPTWRSDKMPYGGIKNSGLGREGIRYAIEEMTELKTLVIKKN